MINKLLHSGCILSFYEGESHENLKLHVANRATIFTLLLCRRVAFLHRTATCRPLFKPWVSLLSTYRQSSRVAKFYHTFKVSIWLCLVIMMKFIPSMITRCLDNLTNFRNLQRSLICWTAVLPYLQSRVVTDLLTGHNTLRRYLYLLEL